MGLFMNKIFFQKTLNVLIVLNNPHGANITVIHYKYAYVDTYYTKTFP